MSKNQQEIIVKACEEKLAKDLILLDVRELTTMTDYLIIVTGNSHLQTQAICSEVEKSLIISGNEIIGKEGYKDGKWIIIDSGETITHIFHKDYRDYYNLEKIWYNGSNLLNKEELHVN